MKKHVSSSLIISACLFLIIILGLCLFFIRTKSFIQLPSDNGFLKVFFCPRDDCEQVLLDFFYSASDIKCAFYDLGLERIISVLKEKNADVLIFEENFNGFGQSISSQSLMHNKFCILDESIVILGSLNPTFRGAYKNNNNLVIVESKVLAQNYLSEFFELKKGDFSKKTKHTKILFNDFLLENYFCPDDSCEDVFLNIIDSANSSVYFMTFSFTSDKIGDLLLEKNDLDIKGVFEKTQQSQFSEYQKISLTNSNIIFDSNPFNMHHKVFIIDNHTVITGSTNPSNNGFFRNDENILVIHNSVVAGWFLEEFEFVFRG
ncbi:MAG: phospholipase D-like domain-containing protein [Nanoarchaeota archaeon]|nr:hypothetical protein [Nanoarchaeota archaeon]MBU1030088.1 hypothetical protein [Nanoarchaeota archaeon]MBU1849950.1 hypothetical protein [Nanoarchaeota archaeon]